MSRITAGIGLKQYLLAHIFILVWCVYVHHKLLQNLTCHQVLFFKHSTIRSTPPKCMLDISLGKHGYVRANGINFHCFISGDYSKPLMLFSMDIQGR